MMLQAVLEQPARARINTIKAVNPAKASQVESIIMRLVQTGQIRGKVVVSPHTHTRRLPNASKNKHTHTAPKLADAAAGLVCVPYGILAIPAGSIVVVHSDFDADTCTVDDVITNIYLNKLNNAGKRRDVGGTSCTSECRIEEDGNKNQRP